MTSQEARPEKPKRWIGQALEPSPTLLDVLANMLVRDELHVKCPGVRIAILIKI